MYANRKAEEGAMRPSKGRSSVMTAAATKYGRQKPAGRTPGGRYGNWCTLHQTALHDNSNCLVQLGRDNPRGQQRGYNQDHPRGHQRGDNQDHPRGQQRGYTYDNSRGTHPERNNWSGFQGPRQPHRNNRAGQQGKQHNGQCRYNNAHANTAVTPSCTTNTYDEGTAAEQPSSATATTLLSPPAGVGFSFMTTENPIRFDLTVDTGASNHFIDNELIPGLGQHMTEYAKIDPPMVINVAGQGKLKGTAKGTLVVLAMDQSGSQHSVSLPFTIVPHLGRHL